MWRKRWVVLTPEALNYYHTDKDTVPRDSLPLLHKDCITVQESAARPCALDITMAEGVGTAGKLLCVCICNFSSFLVFIHKIFITSVYLTNIAPGMRVAVSILMPSTDGPIPSSTTRSPSSSPIWS